MQVDFGSMDIEPQSQHTATVVDEKCRLLLHELESSSFKAQQIDELCGGLDAEEEEVRLRAAVGLRKILSEDESEPYLQRIIDNGTVTKLVGLMKNRRFPQLQFEACWIATNIAYGSSQQCEVLLAKDGLTAIFQLLYENSGPVLEQALWGLGNIAGDCSNCRNTVISKGGIECVVRIITNSDSPTMTEIGIWVLSNLSSGDPAPSHDLVHSALPVIAQAVIQGKVKGQILSSALWSLCLHSEGKKKIRHLLKI
jgi:hypothetical protein